jgi:pantoate--beta-alanine ligase
MKTLRTVGEVRQALEPLRPTSEIGLVPTMGAFHEGHLSLFRAARRECDVVVVSLFVNPSQFAPGEDLDRYPRDEARDAHLAEGEGVDFLFSPHVDEVYPEGFQTWVEVEDLSRRLEGEHRPGHLRGVATICLKLFNVVQPDRAYFGQKDAQQAAVVRRMVGDLDLPIEIRVLPTVRDPDGLALSSRNAYLSPDERRAALALSRALQAGTTSDDPVRAARKLLDEEPLLDLDYLEVAEFDGQPVLLVAARVGKTRLIDNVSLPGGPQ